MEILERAKYIFRFTDDKTDITKIYLFKKKSEVFLQLKKFAA